MEVKVLYELSELLHTNHALFLTAVTLLGLLVGSFLNVVRVRLPIILHNMWSEESRYILGITNDEASTVDNTEQQNVELYTGNATHVAHAMETAHAAHPTGINTALPASNIGLITPRSFCPNCRNMIAWYDNVPVLSFIFLHGKCRHCKAKISLSYPGVELLTAICSFAVAYHLGYGVQTAFALIFTWCLLVQAWIDLEHTFLPDEITLSCLWLGLLISCFDVFVDSSSAILGATAGYLSLYSIYWLFKFATGKEGMGYGDFKLLALVGAWLGWQHLPLVIFLSSCCGAIVGITLILCKRKTLNSKIPFGPYIAAAGWLVLLANMK